MVSPSRVLVAEHCLYPSYRYRHMEVLEIIIYHALDSTAFLLAFNMYSDIGGNGTKIT